MTEKKIIQFKNYGKCLEITNGIVKAVVTLDIGPRIVYYGFKDGENILNTSKEEFDPVSNELMDEHFYKGATWNNFGGHRLWASPEKMPDTYYPDCDPVEYELTENGVILTPKAQVENGQAMSIELSMSSDEPKMDVVHSIENISDKEQDIALWALSVCEKNGLLIVPMNTNDTGLLHNRVISVWSYADLSDERIFFGKKYFTLKQDVNAETAMKFGFDLNDGTAYYVVGNSVFEKKYYPNHPNGRYPDGGVSMETYSCNLFTEVETLSEQKVMAPNETCTHKETWTMHKKPCEINPKDNESIDNFVKNIK